MFAYDDDVDKPCILAAQSSNGKRLHLILSIVGITYSFCWYEDSSRGRHFLFASIIIIQTAAM